MAEKKTVKLIAILLLSCTVLMVTALFYLPELKGALSEHFRRRGKTAIAEFFAEGADLKEDGRGKKPGTVSDEILPAAEAPEMRLAVKLPEKAYISAGDMSVSYDYMTRTLSLVIPGADEDYFSGHPLAGSSMYIEEISTEPGTLKGSIEIRTDRVYEISCLYDSSALYIDFLDPHEVYDHVVVLDPGHGGRMPGTVKSGYNEKDINLAIAMKLRKLLQDSDMNVGVYITRTDDSNPDFSERVGLANDSGADIFVSIHNNSLSGRGKNTTSGVQALYNKEDTTGKSLELSRKLIHAISGETGAEDRGAVDGSDVYVVRSAKMPSTLVEVGFMTNPEELKLLVSDRYQQQVAGALCGGIEEWLAGQ